MPQVRSDKKFPIKLWLTQRKKRFFRSNCLEYHLSMMFVGEQFVVSTLRDCTDSKLQEIIKSRLNKFTKLDSYDGEFVIMGIRITNEWWQKLGYFAVEYDTSVAKITSCIFDYAVDSYELREFYKQQGTYTKKKKKKGSAQQFAERLSDY